MVKFYIAPDPLSRAKFSFFQFFQIEETTASISPGWRKFLGFEKRWSKTFWCGKNCSRIRIQVLGVHNWHQLETNHQANFLVLMAWILAFKLSFVNLELGLRNFTCPKGVDQLGRVGGGGWWGKAKWSRWGVFSKRIRVAARIM